MNVKSNVKSIATVIATMAIPLQPVQSAFPGANGLISFQRVYGWPNMEVRVMNPDGSGNRLLIPGGIAVSNSRWSPSGTSICYGEGLPPSFGDTRHIWIANEDGSNARNITPNFSESVNPSWSHDGKKILFDSDRDGNSEIYIMNMDGSNPIRLTKNNASDSLAVQSPDGTMIAFVSERDGNREIYVMDSDGS